MGMALKPDLRWWTGCYITPSKRNLERFEKKITKSLSWLYI